MSEITTGLVRVAAVTDLPSGGALAVKVNGHAVALFNVDGVIRAIDNRCPHMGYPLVEAPVRAGVLRCPWHHWRFELSTGGCLTTGGDDVGVFTVEVRDGQIYLSPEPSGSDPETRRKRARRFLHQGMTEVNTFLMAKALCSLRGLEEDGLIIRQAVEHGLRFRNEGFGPGLVILTCLLNLANRLSEEDQLLALVHGITHVARDSANRSPRRELPPLPDHGEPGADELSELFRFLCEDREATGAERVLLTVLSRGGPDAAAELLLAAATDHYFLSTGHVIDFINKAYELLDHLGGDLVAAVLGSLVRPIASGFRHEEAADWADMVEPLEAAFAALNSRPAVDPQWADDRIAGVLLDGEPEEIIAALDAAIAAGASLRALSGLLCRAAMLRVARFHLQNENDWDDVLHLVSYCHAVDRLAARFGHRPGCQEALFRAVYHGAMYCHLTRSLNIPKVPLPSERRERRDLPVEPSDLLERLLYCTEFQQVEEAAAVVAAYLASDSDDAALEATLLKALLREDSSFHTFQMVECGIARHQLESRLGEASCALVAATRYLTAQRLRRNILWSTRNAIKLSRGESLNT